MPHQYIKKILTSRVYEAAVETPLDEAPNLSGKLKNRVLLKREDLQPVFSFKIRGAYNKLANLTDDERARGVICASAGNHAQGLAMAASLMGVKATIVMPKPTPDIKVNAVKARGGKAVLHGDTFDEALAYALRQVEEKGYVFIHPYDDPYTIAGQGTIGMEILRQESGPINAIFIPVGGGGLAAGIAVYIKYLRPEIRIIAVESEESACLKAAMEAGERVVLPQVGIFADGIAVAQIGEHTFELCRQYVDEFITVSTDEICAAIKDIFDDTRSITEPAGATALAGLKKYVAREGIEGETLIAIDSGANMNFSRLRYVAERTDLGEKSEALLAVKLPERPGSFRQFCMTLGKRNVTEFNYRYADASTAHVFAGISIGKNGQGKDELLRDLQDNGFEVVDLSDDEMAKLHIRYMIGGQAREITNEVLYRFEFPERPGALLRFLNKFGQRYNVSMFHYRNHGAADGRVLVGMQVEPGEREALLKSMDELGYPYWEVTDNLAYKLFLR
ncbi:threonine dehydratase [Pokkaliibacter plantistimulans]|uniref:L-threonine dehydratase n=2 Tax=Pseudomonadota TaxID=1224 RepID=A0ABX5LVK3_9GAMM|nr:MULTISPECIES: threonine ammonia-lyase, biosynthetic [Pokkaliibacter]MDH2433384.1 threonine ammonia-lyase, biosynthetic [Pokkaliibacter sp. MBI-7]PPC78273.1 threonine ammonia-lyase, biosynthetic [Pokkaliibacter plantistimulans]PXF28740.1 threonine dehydratase [Pokkaliibacter plantistimulans]